MVRQAVLRVEDLHIGDVVSHNKKNVNGRITSIIGTTVQILFGDNPKPESWIRLAGLTLLSPSPPIAPHVVPKLKKTADIVNNVNNDVNNDVDNNVDNNVKKKGRKKKAIDDFNDGHTWRESSIYNWYYE